MSSRQRTEASPYGGYEIWKGWGNFFETSEEQSLYYAKECRSFDFQGKKILEIGFGSGTFLNWASSQGAELSGTEVNPTLVDLGREKGIEILPTDLADSANLHPDQFDAVFAFDVFEHLTLSQIDDALDAIETMLKSGGLVYLRFPNGRSPFGLPSQNGDPTHLTALSDKVLESKLYQRRLNIVRYGPAARAPGNGFLRKMVLGFRYALRDVISKFLNFVYGMSIVWDPVVTLVLVKTSATKDKPTASNGDGLVR